MKEKAAMNKRSKVIPCTIMIFLLAFTMSFMYGCTADTQPASEKLGVAVTILPQAEFLERVGGDKVEVIVMVPSGASPHTYEPVPSQMVRLSEAAMYAKVGSGVEFELTWMDKLIAQNPDMLVVDCSRGVTLQEIMVADEHEHAGEEEADEENHEHGSMDPHIWMSPVNAEIMVNNIAEGLIQVDPDNKSYYEKNRDAYLLELEQLDSDIRGGLSGVGNRVFMVYHPSFGYFASEYDLTMIAIEEEGKEATAAGLEHLIEQALEHNIQVVFADPQFNPESAEVIADEIGGTVIMINPLEENYIENLRDLSSKLVEAMQ